MGNYSCFKRQDRKEAHFEVNDVELEPEPALSKKQTIEKRRTYNFDKSIFIHMKTKSLFNEYEIREKLGEGAYGCVYKVEHKTTKFLRAVKAIKKRHVDTKAFNNEIAILKTVDHPNIIKLFECYMDSNYYYMVQEYCPAGDLYDFLRKQKFFTEKKCASIMKELLSAVNHLHKKNIVHRDLKPENIVFIETKSDEIFIKLIDFGTSISMKNGNLTQELGTIYYIAPEVFKNNYNERADIWSCGIILYTMLCGHPPFCGGKEDIIKKKIIEGNLQFLPKDFNKVSLKAIEFVKRLLTYNPAKRPSADEALDNEWFKGLANTKEDIQLETDVLSNLAKFTSAVTLQKATLSFLANQISVNEEIKNLKDEFDKIDVDHDGSISKEELVNCMKKIYPLDEAVRRANEIFQEIDFNNDGTINFSEFITVNMKKDKLCSEEMLQKAFKIFDVDGNGFITIDELQETVPLDIHDKEKWVEIVKEVDKDGDCQISYDEFKTMMVKLSNL